MNATIGEALRQAARCLTEQGVVEARPAAEVLLADLLVLPRSSLYLDAHCPLTVAQYTQYMARVTRRLHGEPVQYITGCQEFWSLSFAVTPDVLIPRPESELLVEHGARYVRQWCNTWPQEIPLLLDVGTGSGNLAISLAHTLRHSRVWGIDIALPALRVAQRNAARLGVATQVHWVCGDLVTSWRSAGAGCALCVANLPYVTTAEWRQLPREIRDYEPASALLGGDSGLDLIRRLVVSSPTILAPGGTLLLEVGWQQAAAVVELIRQLGQFQALGIYQDFAGIERIVWASMPVATVRR
jgi:release factor glutamine methyltransferase